MGKYWEILKEYRYFVVSSVKFVEAVIRQATAVSFPDMFRHTRNWAQEIAPGKNGLNLVGRKKKIQK